MSATFFKRSAESACKAPSVASATQSEIRNFMQGPLLFVVIIVAFTFRSFLFGLLVELCGVGAGEFSLGAIAEIVKQGGAVGLGPNADLAGVFEGVVLPGEGFFAVKGDDEI